MNWKTFLFKSKSPTSFTPYYYHWLPENQLELLPDYFSEDLKDLPVYYEKFDTLAHITTFENSTEILKNGFKSKIISTNSVVNNKIKLFKMNEDQVQPSDGKTLEEIRASEDAEKAAKEEAGEGSQNEGADERADQVQYVGMDVRTRANRIGKL